MQLRKITLDGRLVSHVPLVRTEASRSPCSALSEQVVALVQLDLDALQAFPVGRRHVVLGFLLEELVLFVRQRLDARDHVLVFHVEPPRGKWITAPSPARARRARPSPRAPRLCRG